MKSPALAYRIISPADRQPPIHPLRMWPSDRTQEVGGERDGGNTYTIFQQPTTTLATKLAMKQRAGAVVGLVGLDALLAFGHGVAGLWDLGRDAEGAACEFLDTQIPAEYIRPSNSTCMYLRRGTTRKARFVNSPCSSHSGTDWCGRRPDRPARSRIESRGSSSRQGTSWF